MDIFKTPHQMLLEEAGAIPATPGLVNTPEQMMMQQSGMIPQYAPGGKVGNLAKFLSESKIPQRLYHGTTASEKGGAEALQQLKQSKEGALGAGVYMTPNPEFASHYANAPGGYVMPVHANIRNPLEIHSTTGGGDPMKAALMQLGVPEAKADQIIEKAYDTRGYIGKEVMSRAQKQGYDGLAQYHDGNLSEVVSYNPMGVKSATGNTGEYNPFDPRLSKAEGGHISPEDMVAELIHNNLTPHHFAAGGRSLLPELDPYFQNIIGKASENNFEQMMAQENPEPTFQAQPQTLTSRARDKVASLIGELPADRLFGTGSEGQKPEYLPLQFLNPISATTETIDAVPETVNQLRRGDTLGAGFTAGATGLGVLPFVKPVKNIIKKIKRK